MSDITKRNSSTPPYTQPSYERRKVLSRKPLPLRTAFAAAALFGMGTLLLLLGLSWLGVDNERGLALTVLGGITFIPGSYATVQLYGAWKGWRGYDYSYVPSYDD